MSQSLNAEIEYRRCCRKYLTELLERRDFAAAVRYFDSIEKNIAGDRDLEYGIIMRLGAKAWASSGNTSKALLLVRTAIDILSGDSGDKREQAEAFILLGDILRELGEYAEAERAFRDAESIFRRNDYLDGAGDALNRLAGIMFRRGDFEQSLRCLLDAVEYARRTDAKKKLAYLFGNIGRVYSLLGRLNSAEEYTQFNIDLSRQFDDKLELARACLSLGYIKIRQGRLIEAQRDLDTASEYIETDDLARERVIYQTYAGELAIKQGDLDQARRLLQRAAENSRQLAPESLLAARPLRWQAELNLRRGNYRRALAEANQARLLMEKLGDQIETAALDKIRAICLEQIGQPEKARELLGRTMTALEKCRARQELAECMVAAGQSNLYDNAQKTMYLCRAEEIYRRIGAEAAAADLQKDIGRIDFDGNHDQIAPAQPGNFLTGNETMKKVVSQMHSFCRSDLPIMLTGETGTGKDHLARYYHSIARPDGPYVAINCAAIPEGLIESELFGHHRGAFTGADQNREGLFAAANGGVLLLDEIGELPLALQPKLLTILETKKLRPLGTSHEIELDIIVVAATNCNLEEMVEAGKFRRDLYYRLTGITLELPPLRQRKEDIPLLLEYFMRKYNLLHNGDRPDSGLVGWFVGYDWPGNVRQLENKVKQLAALSSISESQPLLEMARNFFEDRVDEKAGSLFEMVERFEKRLLREALISSGGNKSEAARMLAIHESTFRAKMKRYSLDAAVN